MDNAGEFFALFLEKGWDEDKAYDLSYFSETHGLRQNVIQYYLKKATYNKVLCCVKVRNKTYYMKRKWFDHFKIFEVLGYVKVY